jgi:hypothetical protein
MDEIFKPLETLHAHGKEFDVSILCFDGCAGHFHPNFRDNIRQSKEFE